MEKSTKVKGQRTKKQDTGLRTQYTEHRTQDTGHRTQDTGHRTSLKARIYKGILFLEKLGRGTLKIIIWDVF